MDSMTILIFVSVCFMFLFMFGLMAAVIFFVFRIGIKRTKAVNQGWEAFARTNYQNFEKGSTFTYPKVTGEYCKRSFVLDIFSVSRGSGRGGSHRTFYTRIATQVDTEIELKIERRGLLDNMFGTTTDASNLDKTFGEKYKVSGDLSPIETPAILAAIQQNNLNTLNIEQGKLTIYVVGFVSRPDVLRELYDLACDIAGLVDG